MRIPSDCIFYQTIELPGVGVIPGSWDHRDAVDVFLGHVDFNQKSVLDVGPANGFFSFEMEKRGAEVTAIDLGEDSPWDVVPHPYSDEETLIANMRNNVRMVENAFWFAHKALKSNVRLVYGSVYDVPSKIKEVDIALMSNVLQHFRDPLLAIQRVAQVVTEVIVITETMWCEDPAFISSTSMRFIPRAETPEANHSWWEVSPSFVIELLKLLGFQEVKCEFHYQKFNNTSTDVNSRMVRHFTLTARRARLLEAATLAKLQVIHSANFYEPESNPQHTWRWSPGPHCEILILNSASGRIDVNVYFGLFCVTSDIAVTILVNGQVAWQGGSFYGIKPVLIPVSLQLGKNTIELRSDGQSVGPSANDQRILLFSLYDFRICQRADLTESNPVLAVE